MASAALMPEPSQSVSPAFSEEMRKAIELELETICNNAQFRTSQRNCSFLRYVTQEKLAGRADEIKERTLGIELFGRPVAYDTGSDAVVRVRANELRKRLICYYETHTSQAGWRIHLPLRTYVPEFVRELPQEESAEEPETGKSAAFAVTAASLAPVSLPSTGAASRNAMAENTRLEKDSAAFPPDPNLPSLPFFSMVLPTMIALFLCIMTFRWQAAYGSPYLDFWQALLLNHTKIAVVLDAAPANPQAVMTTDVQMIAPLLQTAAHFHRATEIANAAHLQANPDGLLTIHITHHPPEGVKDSAAYITVVPGEKAQLWVDSGDAGAINFAVRTLSDADRFPTALQLAMRRNTPTRIRLAENEHVSAQSLPLPPQPEEARW